MIARIVASVPRSHKPKLNYEDHFDAALAAVEFGVGGLSAFLRDHNLHANGFYRLLNGSAEHKRRYETAFARGKKRRGGTVWQKSDPDELLARKRVTLEALRRGATASSFDNEPALPCAATLYNWKKRDPVFAAEMDAILAENARNRPLRRGGQFSKAHLKPDVLDALRSGLKVRTRACIEWPSHLPGYATVSRWLRSDAEFLAAYQEVKRRRIADLLQARQAEHNRYAADRKTVTSKKAGPTGAIAASGAEALQGRLLQNAIYAAADKALSRAMEPEVRSDIISDITIAVLEGEIAFEDIATESDFYRKEHARHFDPRRTASLDEELFNDGAATRMDFLRVDPLYAE